MKYDYFELLIETERTYRKFIKLIKDYMLENHIPCNITQIVVLHFLIKMNGTASPTEIHKETEVMCTNNYSNFQSLIKYGYITQKSGRDIEMDSRCVFLYITEKGKELYKDLCDFTNEKMKHMKEDLQWEEDDFINYLSDLSALQEVLES